MRLYGEQFILLHHAISDLGATVTEHGLPNRRSPWVFAVQMIISGVMCLRYARRLAHPGPRVANPHANDHRAWLIRMCAAGFFLMPAPHNLPVMHYVHMFGGGFIFFSLWMLSMIYLSEGRKRGLRKTFWVGMVILQATVLTYAFFFAINSPSKQFAQGVGLLGLLIVLTWASRMVAHTEPLVAELPDKRHTGTAESI